MAAPTGRCSRRCSWVGKQGRRVSRFAKPAFFLCDGTSLNQPRGRLPRLRPFSRREANCTDRKSDGAGRLPLLWTPLLQPRRLYDRPFGDSHEHPPAGSVRFSTPRGNCMAEKWTEDSSSPQSSTVAGPVGTCPPGLMLQAWPPRPDWCPRSAWNTSCTRTRSTLLRCTSDRTDRARNQIRCIYPGVVTVHSRWLFGPSPESLRTVRSAQRSDHSRGRCGTAQSRSGHLVGPTCREAADR